MSRGLTEVELRALNAAKEAAMDKRVDGRMFDRPMITQGEVVVVRAVIRSLFELTPQVRAAAEGGGQASFEDRWQRAINAASPPDEA